MNAISIKEVINFLNVLAPPVLQEHYDNAGLIVGDSSLKCSGVLVCLDSTEAVIEEAIENGCNLIIAHHPIVFSGLKKITGKNYIERVVIKAIKNDIAIFAIHTNLDNVIAGVNGKMAQILELKNTQVLAPKKDVLSKLITYVPNEHLDKLKTALFSSGAGSIGNYDECSFSSSGLGSFRALEGANPYVGNKNEQHIEREVKLEVIYPNHLEREVIKALKNNHPYEEVAYDCIALKNTNQNIGAGIIGNLEQSIDLMQFLTKLKGHFNVGCLKYTQPINEKVQKIAYCGGSGSFLLNDAIHQGADVFITGDFKYHQFFDADKRIVIVDIGHYESEFLTINLLVDKLKENFTTFAVLLTNVNTNPINFL
jgi:dinuclear metal center YbgI/SA1388 family protein